MNKLDCSGIYCFTCIPNGKVYVGRSINVHKRIIQHRNDAKTANLPFYHAIRKYGWENFKIDLLEQVDDPIQLISREQHWIDTLHAADRKHGYNLCPHGDGPLGFKHGSEMRAKMSARKGEKRPPKSDEEKARLRSYWTNPEVIAKRQATCARKRAERLAALPPKPPKPVRVPKPPKTKKGTPEYSQKLSEAQKRRTDRQSPEYRAKARDAQLKRWANRSPKPPKMTRTEKRKAEQIERCQAFLTEYPTADIHQLAAFLGVSTSTAKTRLQEAGCTVARKVDNRTLNSKRAELLTFLRERTNQWLTLDQLAEHFQTNKNTIQYWLYQEGFTKKGGRWHIPESN